MSDWQPIETAPKDGQLFLATDGTLLGTASRWIFVEPETKGDLQRFLREGAPMHTIPNPKAGNVSSGWAVSAFHAFDGSDERNSDGDGKCFEPTHWMPLPSAPVPRMTVAGIEAATRLFRESLSMPPSGRKREGE